MPQGAAGQWCRLRVRLPADSRWWARATLEDPSRAQIVRSVFLGPWREDANGAWRETLFHAPATAAWVSLQIFGVAAPAPVLSLAVLPRWQAALRLVWQGRQWIPSCLAGSPAGLVGRLRAVLGQAPARAGEAPPYDVWIEICETALPAAPQAAPLDIQAVILGDAAACAAATLASLQGQTLPCAHPPRRIVTPEDWNGVAAEWVLILQPGETLAPDALAWFAAAAARHTDATCLVADFDTCCDTGERKDPVFLPGADALFLRCGLAGFGACALRWRAGTDTSSRQAMILSHAASCAHVPRILTHRPPWAPPARAAPCRAIREAGFLPRVTALVPSQARSGHVTHCLGRIVGNTRYPDLRVRVLLSAPLRARPLVLRRLQVLPGVDVQSLQMETFNYALVNNAGAAACNDADFLLLLNDDVAPIAPDWLDGMVAHMQDPRVGIVGARLLYGNDMVQHEGVILGLADLCEHAGRLRPGSDAGPHGIGRVSRDVSAVTAACLLVRAGLYRDLGGMDSGFAIALNDVDFCLRARQAGWRIVYCAEAILHHYESLSLGRHYAGGRAALESLEVRQLRDRWAGQIAADSYYNELASLEPGREWQPAFPPRATWL